MTRSTIATVLNFVVPGTGLWYLGMRALGVVNLLVATALIVLLTGHVVGGDQIHYVILAVAAGSSGLAHAIGNRVEDSRQRPGAVASSTADPELSETRRPFDLVDEASAESFPASDPPCWTSVTRP